MKKNDWREKFDKEFPMRLNMAGWEDFIIKEIIEGIFDQLPTDMDVSDGDSKYMKDYKQLLIEHWL